MGERWKPEAALFPSYSNASRRIRVHVFYCVLALAIAHLVRREAERAGPHLSVRELKRRLPHADNRSLETGGR